MYVHTPLEKPHFLGGISGGAVREVDCKLVEFFETEKLELYNLAKDVGEKNNLADKQPRLAERLQNQLIAWRKSIGATKEPPKR